jgi:hypothetical protein
MDQYQEAVAAVRAFMIADNKPVTMEQAADMIEIAVQTEAMCEKMPFDQARKQVLSGIVQQGGKYVL